MLGIGPRLRRIRLPDGLIPTACGILALASFCLAGFVTALWVGLLALFWSLSVVAVLVELSERKS
jgi:hypothetical protein